MAAQTFEVFSGFSSHPEHVCTGHPVQSDFRNPDRAIAVLRQLQPQAIINAAAVNPGGSEDEMELVNHLGARVIASVAGELRIRWVQVSTDVVHDGRRAPYDDAADPSPWGAYARSKARVERAVLDLIDDAVVVRTSLIYGFHEIDRGTDGFVQRLAAGKPLRLFSDVIRQPVWVDTLAAALIELVSCDYRGYLNVTGDEAISREAFGRQLLGFWRVKGAEQIEPVEAKALGIEVPLDLRLRLDRARKVLRCPLIGFTDALARQQMSSESLLFDSKS